MSIASRLALALVLVAVGATALWGLSVRRTSQQLLSAEFDARMQGSGDEAKSAIVAEASELADVTSPLCKRDALVERTLGELDKNRGDASALREETGSQLALSHHVSEEATGRGIDELSLVAGDGTVLASSNRALVGRKEERLAKWIRSEGGPTPSLSPVDAEREPSIEIACVRSGARATLALVASRKIGPLLMRIGRAHSLTLTPLAAGRSAPASTARDMVRIVEVPEVRGLMLVVSMSRDREAEATRKLDREILASGAVAALFALLLAVILGRSVAKPLRELAHETREVVSGEPRPVRVRGGLEIRELAQSFNKTIDQLAGMKKRLAVTERISARREIARQVAHEIKNPLAPIRAAVETLRRLRERDDERFDDYFDEATRTVLEEVHRIASIVSEFTKFQRLPAPNPEPMDLVAAARGVVSLHAADPELVRTGGQDAEPRVELATEGDIPLVKADRDQIVQVLTNLVQNGLDAASAVRSDPRVVVTVGRVDDAHVRVVVRDNGPGVTEEMRERLFEPYATSKPTGTGLGLAICQRIVFEHGGEIAYRPATKGGAVFEIRLPIHGPSLLEKPLETTAQPVSRMVDSPHAR